MEKYVLNMPDASVWLYPSFFSTAESSYFFERLENLISWEQRKIRLFGKEMMQPRLIAYYGDADSHYTYSGQTWQPQTWTDELLIIKKRVEEVSLEKFSSVLLNLYRNGQDSMGWHSDDEPELGYEPVIASISFGVERKFSFRYKANRQQKVHIQLTNGSLLLMAGKTQHFWQHQVPKQQKINSPRINLTFRRIK